MDRIILLFLVLCGKIEWSFSLAENFMQEKCGGSVSELTAGRLEVAREITYGYNRNCKTTISVPSGQRIIMFFKRFSFEDELDGSCTDTITIHDGSSTSAAVLLGPTCGTIQQDFNLTSSGTHVTFHFVSDSSANFWGFDVIYVGFTSQPCEDDQFQCSNTGLCIDSGLECDDIDECGDESDEAACSAEEIRSREPVSIIGIIIGCVTAGVILIIIVIIIIYKCYVYYYWKNWLKNNQSKKYPWEENDNDLYRYPKTDKYQIYEIGRKGRLEPQELNNIDSEEVYFFENKAAVTEEEGEQIVVTKYLDEI